jgi:hypothetical protein
MRSLLWGFQCGIITRKTARSWWLTSVILATQKAEIRRVMVQTHLGQIVREITYTKKKK